MIQEVKYKEKINESVARPPVVVVMGHIDHGKTTLLDFIRKSGVAAKESGGITQHIGAYQTEHNGKKITFIDTPGHEAFFKMRSRGVHVADIAVLVVAADEGVKPQTEEAIATIKRADISFIVVVNKIDKPEANVERVKRELAEREIMLEGYGGNVPVAAVSAKTGQGVQELLETILILAELEELKTDPGRSASGAVIESRLDPRRGPTATLLINDGVLRRGQFILVGDQIAPVRILEDFRGQAIEEAWASDPVRIVGFVSLPGLGEEFRGFSSRIDAENQRTLAVSEKSSNVGSGPGAVRSDSRDKTVLNIVLKTDVSGSKEALEEILKSISASDVDIRILRAEAGEVTESDVMLASSDPATILGGFRVKISQALRELAERKGVKVVLGDVIYELVEAMKSVMREAVPAKLKRVDIGRALILAIFRESQGKQVVGGRVEAGKIQKGVRFDLIRNGVKIGGGKALGLQTQRRDVEEVGEGQEFGILSDVDVTVAVGDRLDIYTEEKIVPQI